jgi:uncharacterized protein with HEPN domain
VRDDAVFLRHIVDAIETIERYTSVGRDQFMSESHWRDATIRQLEIVGEATKQLSPEVRSRHPFVPWRRMAGLRDVLIHQHMGVDLDAVWEVAAHNAPALRAQVEQILASDFDS